MITRTLILAAFTATALTAAASADDRIHVTPPLFREQARATAAVRPAAELTTIPTLVGRAPTAQPLIAQAKGVEAR